MDLVAWTADYGSAKGGRCEKKLKILKFQVIVVVLLLAIAFGLGSPEAKAQAEEKWATVLPVAKYPWDQSMVNGIIWGARMCSLFGIAAEAATEGVDLAKLLVHIAPDATFDAVETLQRYICSSLCLYAQLFGSFLAPIFSKA